jgi:hypothetical protein
MSRQRVLAFFMLIVVGIAPVVAFSNQAPPRRSRDVLVYCAGSKDRIALGTMTRHDIVEGICRLLPARGRRIGIGITAKMDDAKFQRQADVSVNILAIRDGIGGRKPYAIVNFEHWNVTHPAGSFNVDYPPAPDEIEVAADEALGWIRDNLAYIRANPR